MHTKFCRRAVLTAISMAALIQTAPAIGQTYPNNVGQALNYAGTPAYNQSGNASFIPAGMTLNASLSTSISTDSARPGDFVQATLSDPVTLADGTLPAGSVIEGRVVAANAGGFLGRAGRLSVKFNQLRMASGVSVPLSASIVGDLGKYSEIAAGSGTYAGETVKTKAGQAVLRTAIGAGAGAALGTAVGAIAGRGNPRVQYRPYYGPYGHAMMPMGYYPQVRSGASLGAGRGAWSGAAIGGGLGLADSLLLRKGKNVVISSGTPIQLRLDAPVSLNLHHQYGNS